jgi:hypothetical protein
MATKKRKARRSVAVRISEELQKRIDRKAAQLQKRTGIPATTSDVIRLVLSQHFGLA